MSAARKSAARPRGLLLVKGGLGAHGGGGDQDWDDFCHRIGWQAPAPEPDDDFEKRIAEGLSAKASVPDNVVELDLARSIREALSAPREACCDVEEPISGIRWVPVAREAGVPSVVEGADESASPDDDGSSPAEAPEIGDAERRGSRILRAAPRATVAVFTLALAAAVLLAVLKLAVFAPRPDGGSMAPTADLARATPVSPPRVDRPLPEEVAPIETARPESDPAEPRKVKPAPKPRKTGPETPPGTRLARRSADEAAETPEAESRPVLARMDSALPADRDSSRLLEGAPVWAQGSDTSASWGGRVYNSNVPAVAERPRVAFSSVDSLAPSPVRAGGEVWAQSPPAESPTSEERERPASWSLGGSGNRWIGASLAPSTPAYSASNIGVMVELDLGKAFALR